ncbi:hypothetical protein FA048_04830 [Pedobacter polaris]|uniref:Lipoprotein n=1 Tax=Pedobacter polaris TaxID=2571273 RepID=A0A4U1CW49_9SPHI|nr:hypothetical protein [Pedobacter polaris]TKC12946.1 hypothetical protein FA048_04830 [Pedobacter polaris]
MRQNLLLLTIIGILLSCNQADKKTAGQEITTVAQLNDTIATNSEQQIIIAELKRLQAVFSTNDKEKVADIFSFPISNEKLGIYIDNDNFNEQLAKNNNRVTRSMFISFYQDISESLQIDQLNQLFKKLHVENLITKESLEHKAIIKTEPCYHFYGVKVENKLVTLTLGTNSNKGFKGKTVSEDEISENDSSICEYVIWWVFKFDGKQLQLKEISAAG